MLMFNQNQSHNLHCVGETMAFASLTIRSTIEEQQNMGPKFKLRMVNNTTCTSAFESRLWDYTTYREFNTKNENTLNILTSVRLLHDPCTNY